jgi:hypothetical protein
MTGYGEAYWIDLTHDNSSVRYTLACYENEPQSFIRENSPPAEEIHSTMEVVYKPITVILKVF